MHAVDVTFGAVSWPCISHLCPNKNRTGTAYGIAASVQNIGFFFIPLMVSRRTPNLLLIELIAQVGAIKDKTGSDSAVEQLFTCVAIGATVLATLLARTEEGEKLNEVHHA